MLFHLRDKHFVSWLCVGLDISWLPQDIQANFLCDDECITSQSLHNPGDGIGVLLRILAFHAKPCSEFPLMEIRCITRVNVAARLCLLVVCSVSAVVEH